MINKIGIGTVQFGLDYGISNATGRVQEKEVEKILKFAKEKGIEVLDTARAYGKSEEVLGRFAKKLNSFQVVSKLPAGLESVSKEINKSLILLKQEKLYAYLFHDFADFEKNPLFWEGLKKEKENGRVKKIGFSLYYPEQIEKLWKNNIKFDILQVPYNIFDRRFEPYFEKLKSQNVEIHVRSIFLQGLFFMNVEKLSTHLDSAKNKIKKIQQISTDNQLPLAGLLLYFVLQNPYVHKAIIGLSSFEDLKENLNVLSYFEKMKRLNIDFSSFNELNEKIILPFLWEN